MREVDRPMHLVLEVSPFSIGGPQAWVCDIAQALGRRGLRVEVLSFELSTPRDSVFEERLRRSGIPVERVVLTGCTLQKMWRVYSAIRSLRHCDVLHTNSDVLSGLFLFFAKSCGIKVRIAHARTPNFQSRQKGLKNRFAHKMLHWLSRRYCSHAFGVTRGALENLVSQNRDGRMGGQVVPSAICTTKYEPKNNGTRMPSGEKVVIGFIGRITSSKNPRFLVEVLARVRARGINAELLLVGAGPDEGGVREDAERLGMTAFVVLLPPQEDVAAVLAESIDVVALPSDYEGTPRVVLEAQASGIPVVCSTAVPTDVSVVPELFQRISLADDADAWAEGILRAIGRNVPSQRIAECFAGSAFNIENQADTLVGLYEAYVSQ